MHITGKEYVAPIWSSVLANQLFSFAVVACTIVTSSPQLQRKPVRVVADSTTGFQTLQHLPCGSCHALQLANYYLNPDTYHLSSGALLQQKFGRSAALLDSRLRRLAATLWLQQTRERELLESRFAATLPPEALLFYLDVSSYDETPMRIALADPQPVSSHDTGLQAPSLAMAFAHALTSSRDFRCEMR